MLKILKSSSFGVCLKAIFSSLVSKEVSLFTRVSCSTVKIFVFNKEINYLSVLRCKF